MSAKRSRDVTFSTDDQACRTMILDLGDEPANKGSPIEGDATVVLDLTATQVRHVLTTPATGKPARK